MTAVGPGGVGKTRLALTVVADVAADFADGVWFVDLVPISSPDMCVVAGTAAMTLGIGEQPGRGFDRAVLAALADRNALLVLDNCEHVRDGVAPFVEQLLAACPGMSVLATSRARLMVPFERVYTVPPMSLAGEGDSDAVALFMDRAAAGGWAAPEVVSRVERAVELVRGTRDLFAESAALDTLAAAQSRAGDLRAAAATARRQIRQLQRFGKNRLVAIGIRGRGAELLEYAGSFIGCPKRGDSRLLCGYDLVFAGVGDCV
ncbi:hypothetical protein ACQP1O_29925 [Nocardia sp. CA-151230]|uniref:hypothetical protein n=1 Tax=Nocardia sp. CA-151230 TaxID=3239982 RepID=UPI003D8A1D85